MSNPLRSILRRLTAILALSVLIFSAAPTAYAAPFGLRFTTVPATDYTPMSRINVEVQAYDQATNTATNAFNGTVVTLALLRCPGSPAPCTPVVIDSTFATVVISGSAAKFFNMTIGALNSDYFFSATATGLLRRTTSIFDVVGAYAVVDLPISTNLTVASQFEVDVSIHRGSFGGPIDIYAGTGSSPRAINLDLYLCSDAACIGDALNTNNWRVASLVNGVATISNANVPVYGGAGRSYFLRDDTTSIVTTQSDLFLIEKIVSVVLPSSLTNMSTFARFSATIQGRVGVVGGPIDTLADGVGADIDLERCTVPLAPCDFVTVVDDWRTGTLNDGTITFNDLNITPPNSGYILVPYITNSTSLYISNRFDVAQGYLDFIAFTPPNSIASRFPVTVYAREGGRGDAFPTDSYADGQFIRFDLRQCTSVTGVNCFSSTAYLVIDTSEPMENGITMLTNVRIATPAPNLIMRASEGLSSVGDVIETDSTVFSVPDAYVQIEPQPVNVFVGQSFSPGATVRVAGSGLVDPLADGLDFSSTLLRCTGAGGSCVTTDLFASPWLTDLTQDGVIAFPLTTLNVPGRYYFTVQEGGGGGIDSAVSAVFSVFENNSFQAFFTVQGRPLAPSALLQVPVIVQLKPTSGGAFRTAMGTATVNGQLVIANVFPGTYTMRIKTAQTLAAQVAGVVVTTPGTFTFGVGALRNGDANDDNAVNITDFSILAATFGKTSVTPGYDARADFNGDNVVNITDFSLLAASFGQVGAPALVP